MNAVLLGGYLLMTAVLFVVALSTVMWMVDSWRVPEAAAETAFPEPDSPRLSFSLLVPARHEERVLASTVNRLLLQDHPRFEVLIIVGDDDEGTAAVARSLAEADPRVTVVVDDHEKKNKPRALNAALPACAGDIIGVVDAEDQVATTLLRHVDAVFRKDRAHVVQGGVQLMNLGSGLGKWFQVHNVLEYFFWFTSRMAFHASTGFVPLGGNTVFVRRELLERAGGWPLSITEDCALGVRLSTQFGAKVATAYSARLTTREEAPPSIFNKETGSLFWQRDRWVRGFLE
ncbi:MAG: glycosyltransferase, partial [Actinomycetes bacterium]